MKEGLITVLLLKLDQSPTDPVLIHRIVEVPRIWRWCSQVLYMNAILTMLAGQVPQLRPISMNVTVPDLRNQKTSLDTGKTFGAVYIGVCISAMQVQRLCLYFSC